ncbi:MAG: chromate transporter, partial [Oscillospiraceae bacterium]
MIYLNLFYQFFKIGLFTIGGGYAMIPLIQDIVISENWISSNELVNFIAIAESTPGPFAVNIATFVGMNTVGLLGAFLATLGVITPGFIIILVIAKYFHTFKDNKFVKASLIGLRPIVIGLILSAGFSIALSNLFFEL